MPGWTRTNDPQLRRLMLYPTELRAHRSATKRRKKELSSTTMRINHLLEFNDDHRHIVFNIKQIWRFDDACKLCLRQFANIA
jgi:hypothetical protein